MDIEVIRPADLTMGQIDVWRSLMDSESATDSPFFDPQYSMELSGFREQIRVAIVKENGIPVAFFTFEKHGRIGHPLGIKLCDFQGFIGAPEAEIDAREFLSGCDLKVLCFDHMLASQPEFKPWHLRQHDSFYTDISSGFDEYVVRQRGTGSRFIPKTGQKRRKLEKEFGELRFEWHSRNVQDLKLFMKWKSDQRKRTGTFDILQFRWASDFLEKFLTVQSENFSGIFSTLKIDDRLVAASLGMKTQTVRHIWMTSYCPELEHYSPGNILRLEVIKASAEHGIRRVDFGKGEERCKKSLKTGGVMVAEGAVDFNPFRKLSRCVLYKLYERTRCCPMAAMVETPKRFVRGLAHERQMKQQE